MATALQLHGVKACMLRLDNVTALEVAGFAWASAVAGLLNLLTNTLATAELQGRVVSTFFCRLAALAVRRSSRRRRTANPYGIGRGDQRRASYPQKQRVSCFQVRAASRRIAVAAQDRRNCDPGVARSTGLRYQKAP